MANRSRRRLTSSRRKRISERLKHWRAKLRALKAENAAKPLHPQNCGWDLHCFAVVQRRIDKWESELLEKETVMRAGIVDDAPAISKEWPWRAWTTLNIGGTKYARGSVIPDDVLTACANCDHLVRNGYVRRMAALPGKQVKTPAPVTLAIPRQASDPIAECQKVLREASKKRGITKREALDVVNQDLVERAIRAIGEQSRTVKTGAWGSGNPTEQQTGVGTVRRIVDDAYDVLCADEPEKEKAA
jgi:hypothetical protein